MSRIRKAGISWPRLTQWDKVGNQPATGEAAQRDLAYRRGRSEGYDIGWANALEFLTAGGEYPPPDCARCDNTGDMGGGVKCTDCHRKPSAVREEPLGVNKAREGTSGGARETAPVPPPVSAAREDTERPDMYSDLEAAGLTDAEIDDAQYKATRNRVIAGKASINEAAEFIDFIEGAIPTPVRDTERPDREEMLDLIERLSGWEIKTTGAQLIEGVLAAQDVLRRSGRFVRDTEQEPEQ